MTNPNCIHCGGELPGFARVPETVARTSKTGDCRHGFAPATCCNCLKDENERLRAYINGIADGAHEGAHLTWIKSMAVGALRGDSILVGEPGSWRRLPPETGERKLLLSDRADELIRELHGQGMVTMRSVFDGAILTILPGRPAQKARVARKDCKTCLGYGMVGGFVSPDSGYQSDPCPDCSPENGEGSQT